MRLNLDAAELDEEPAALTALADLLVLRAGAGCAGLGDDGEGVVSSASEVSVHSVDDAPRACRDALFAAAFTVSAQVDRVGMRLRGAMLRVSSGHGASVRFARA